MSEFQPDIANGGRANTIAVNPANNSLMLVASETGGLFRSTNGGITWRHVDTLPEYATPAVVFVDANIAIATASEDFRIANGGGIWRSTDTGNTWTQVPSPSAPAGVTGRFGGGEISIAPDNGHIFIATTFGIGISSDQGVTWSYVRPFTVGDGRVFAVLAQAGNHVLAGGPNGIARSTDGGTTWTPASAGPGGIWDMHALGGSPFSATQAYAVNGATNLFFTEDAGDHWTLITAAPTGGGGCGGIGFVKARPIFLRRFFPPRFLRRVELYFGNRCGVSQLVAPEIATTGRFDYSGAWTGLNVDHGDTRDLAFNSLHLPLLLATDGGLHKTADGGLNWTFTGGGHNGYNALQITEVRGQWINDIGRHDLYFGTQDNNLYSSGDDGATWTYGTCCEGFFIEGQHRVPSATDSQISFVACSGCGNFRSGALFSGITGWANPAGDVAGNPKILRESFHVQGVDGSGGFSPGFASTPNLGTAWTQYAAFAEDRRDLPRGIQSLFSSVLYQSIRTGWDSTRNFEIDHLVRVSKSIFLPSVSVTYPAMNNFGGLGVNPTMFAWYQVFAVDPGDSSHIIAPDIVNEKMMATHDGGNNWTENTQLTGLVTDHGNFMFRSSIFPQASAIAFSADNPNLVAVGTFQNGIFISSDRGETWSKVPDSDKVTYITAFDWRTPQDLIVSTYGRGLWRVQWSWRILWRDFPQYCTVQCLIQYRPNLPDPPPDDYRNTVVVFDGAIQGARIVNGVLRELFVKPGSNVVYFSESEGMQKPKVTEARKQTGLAGAPQWAAAAVKGKQVLAGFALGKNGTVAGVVLASAAPSLQESKQAAPQDKEKSEQAAQEQEKRERGREESPTANKPYLRLRTGEVERTNQVAPGRALELSGHEFASGAKLEISVDEIVVQKLTVGPDRVFKVAIPAPQEFGMHRLVVRDQEGKVVDGFMFLVSHEDAPPPKKPSKPQPRKQTLNQEPGTSVPGR